MKKYKLIKIYPGSPPLNSIIENWMYTYDISKEKDYWQEIVDKDYEILSFSTEHLNQIVHFNGHKTIRFSGYISDFTVEDLIKNRNFKIHSVKRPKDNIIFTIGDYVQEGRIINIIIKKDLIYLEI